MGRNGNTKYLMKQNCPIRSDRNSQQAKKAVHAEFAQNRDVNASVTKIFVLFATYRARVAGPLAAQFTII